MRRIQPFRQFLDVAAQMNTKIINYNKISQDIGIEIPTVQNYFSILEDTFVGFLLNPFHESVRKRQRSNPKFYFFDIGVVRSLQNRLKINIATGTYDYGILFEQFFILEVLRLNAYFKKSFRFYYLKTHGNVEVDLIIERPGQHYLFIEIKSTNEIRSLHSESLTGFSKLVKDFKKSIGYVVSQDPIAREEDEIRFRPWDIFLQETFNKQ